MTGRHKEPLTDEGWQALARQVLITREEIRKILRMMSGRVPAKTIDMGLRVDRQLDQLRSTLEEEMFKRGGPKDITIFWPGTEGPPAGDLEGSHADALLGVSWRDRAVSLIETEERMKGEKA